MDAYSLLKSLHIVGVILFVGNIIVTAWWKTMANRTRNPAIVAFAQRQVVATDWAFTLGGIVLLAIGGYGNAILSGVSFLTPWVLIGNILFIASGLIWIAVLVPLQARLGRMAREFAAAASIPDAYWRLERSWLAFGILATVLPLAAVPVMVFKIG